MHSECWSHFLAGFVQIVHEFIRISPRPVFHISHHCIPELLIHHICRVTVEHCHIEGMTFFAIVVQIVPKVHKDFSQAGFSYFWPFHFPNYSSTTSAIYFLKQSSFKGQVWNLSNHKKQSEQF